MIVALILCNTKHKPLKLYFLNNACTFITIAALFFCTLMLKAHSKTQEVLVQPKILIVTDAWKPQVNGVVTTLIALSSALEHKGYDVSIIHPGLFRVFSLPFYPEIKVAWDVWALAEKVDAIQPDYVHIAVEGPLGIAARWYCLRHKLQYTTALHSNFPEFLQAYIGFGRRLGYMFLRWFHGCSAAVLVNTPSQKSELEAEGLSQLEVWSKGVDQGVFYSTHKAAGQTLVYVGRVSTEKNIVDFLKLRTNLKKVVVGDGPELLRFRKSYPNVEFVGYKHGIELAEYYRNAQALIFPSKTDTFGMVCIEAIACGTPVVAYPVTGPKDIIQEGVNGALDNDLEKGLVRALRCNRTKVAQSASVYSWSHVANQFSASLVLAKRP